MKSDLDRLMQENDIEALLITGPAQHNPMMFYLTGGGHLTHADLIKVRGKEPVLFYSSMERDEAANTGLKIINFADYPYKDILKDADGDRILAAAMRYNRMLRDQGISAGRVSLYGKVELNEKFGVFTALQNHNSDLRLIGEPAGQSILLQAMATKDEEEIKRIRGMGKITTEVVAKVAEYLSSRQARDGMVVQRDGKPLTIGDIKSKINLWLAERGVENPHGTIFSQGHDAGVPHSSGNEIDPLVLGKPIIFDIFPSEGGGGYHYDFTRTWCIGYADKAAEALYDDVRSTYETIMAELQVNAPTSDLQERTCELFEERGHPTIRQDPSLQEGYVHSLGHGLGLHVHEAPWFRGKDLATSQDVLLPGSVVTIEPGLYYPEREMGCRLEDTVWVRPDGGFEILAEYPLDLIIPIETVR